VTRELLVPLISAGGGNFPGALSAYRSVMAIGDTAAFWSLWRGREAIVFSGYTEADTRFARRIWNLLEQARHQFFALYPELSSNDEIPREPPPPPWIASVVLPHLGWVAQKDIPLIANLNLTIGVIIHEQGE
jgi:hypothetical protein